MKFSDRTLDILKNFATINQSIGFKEGNVLKTISPHKTIMATAKIEEDIPGEACVYDLNQFLSIYSSGLISDIDVEFGESEFTLTGGENKSYNSVFVYADKSMIITPPDKNIDLPSTEVSIDVKWDVIEAVVKAGAIYNIEEITFIGEDGEIKLAATGTGKGNRNQFAVKIGETEDTFRFVIKRENIKLLEDDYKVSISSKGISKFESDTMTYFIATEAKASSFKKG